MKNDILISIVVPVYNESGNIRLFIDRINKITIDNHIFEVIFVNDGSTDASLIELKKNVTSQSNLKYISFSRNFGHQNALKAGLDYAEGDAVISMDGDLQHPPELIPELVENWHNGFDIVYTLRKDNEETGIVKRATANLFYNLMNRLSDIRIEKGSADFRLLDKKVVTVLKGIKETPIFYRGMVEWVGFKKIGVEYVPEQRQWGETKYSLSKMFKFALLGITSFSIKPLQLSIYIGTFVAVISFLYGLYALWIKVFTEESIQGWTSTLIVISFIGGIQLMMIGVIGEYLGKLFIEAKNRPPYIISESSYEDK
jgi:dolichol-phosphate mannosyltransferase